MHIIKKYSGRIPGGEDGANNSELKSIRRIKRTDRRDTRGSFSPGASAVRALQEHGGIETIIQEAAKGVYSRGEKWGLNKALRGAMEGLQSGTNAPRRQLEVSRWSLDTGTHVPSVSKLVTDIKTLEQRSTALAKLLEKAIEELWIQQRHLDKDKDEGLANASV